MSYDKDICPFKQGTPEYTKWVQDQEAQGKKIVKVAAPGSMRVMSDGTKYIVGQNGQWYKVK